MVDDVMSAGSALAGTYTELQDHGAAPVVAERSRARFDGAISFRNAACRLKRIARDEYEMWLPLHAHLRPGQSLEDVATPPLPGNA